MNYSPSLAYYLRRKKTRPGGLLSGGVVDTLAAPTNIAAPSISGAPVTGSTLTANRGSWSASPTPIYDYQWKRGGVSISGATGTTYTIVIADQGATLTVTVTATNDSGSASSTSTATAVVTAAPVAPSNTVAPALSASTANVGTAISVASSGTWSGSPAPTYTYQWIWADTGASISGATSSSYTPVSADVGHTLLCAVTATNASGSASASTNTTSAVASTPLMPSGALGIWYMDQYVTTKPAIMATVPNSVLGTSPSTNLVAAPRRQFANSQFYIGGGSISSVDANATGADGAANAASTITTSSGDWTLTPGILALGQVSLPAGNYTVGVNVRWKGTGSANFKLGDSNGTQTLKTATTSWARYSVSFTADGSTKNVVCMRSPDTTSASAFEIDFFNIFPGTSDLGSVGDDGHMYLSRYWSAPTLSPYASGAVTFNVEQTRQIIQFSSPQSLSAFTCIYVASHAGTGSNAAEKEVLSDPVAANNFAVGPVINGSLGPRLSGAQMLLHDSSPDLYSKVGNGFFVGAQSQSSTTTKIWHNGSCVNSNANSPTFPTIQDLLVGCIRDNDWVSGLAIHAIALYPRELTAAEHASAYAALLSHASTAGVTMGVFDSHMMAFEGDSITYYIDDTQGAGAGGYAHRLNNYFTNPLAGGVFAQNGNKIADLVTRAPYVDAALANKGSKKATLHVWIGANDLTGSGAGSELTAFISALQSYITNRRAAGWDKIVVGTIIDRTGAPISSLSQRVADAQSANNTIRSWVANGQSYSIDAVSDFAGTSGSPTVLYPNGTNATNTTYYNADGIHPASATHAGLLRTTAGAAIASV